MAWAGVLGLAICKALSLPTNMVQLTLLTLSTKVRHRIESWFWPATCKMSWASLRRTSHWWAEQKTRSHSGWPVWLPRLALGCLSCCSGRSETLSPSASRCTSEIKIHNKIPQIHIPRSPHGFPQYRSIIYGIGFFRKRQFLLWYFIRCIVVSKPVSFWTNT